MAVTRPRGKVAALLTGKGITTLPIEEDEGNTDRYILGKRLAVERRTGSSFLRGILDRTLFTSAIYLREHFELPVLIIEGEINYGYTAFNPQAVRGALSSLILSYGLSVLSTPNAEETASLIAMMARQEQEGIPEISLIPKRKATDLDDMQRRIVEMLPGCGRVVARDLLQYFGNVRRIVNATKEELCRVRGIGPRKAAEMHKVLNAEYESVDTERDLEDAIEADPGLLFRQPVTLVARQHQIRGYAPGTAGSERQREGEQRLVVDLVFLDPAADELILVELKRGALAAEHYDQIRRYLDHAHESQLLRSFLDKGTRIRGILATVARRESETGDAHGRDGGPEEASQGPRPSVHVVDEQQAIAVLRRLRRRRLERLAAEGCRDGAPG